MTGPPASKPPFDAGAGNCIPFLSANVIFGLRTANRGGAVVAEKPLVEIEYCTQCRWLLRAAWMAQELLSTFEEEIGGVTLVPGTGGVFEVRVGGRRVWSRKGEGGFPEISELKRRVRDVVAPERDLGHLDRAGGRNPAPQS